MSHQVPPSGARTPVERLYQVLTTTLGARAEDPVRVELGGKDKAGHGTTTQLSIFILIATDAFSEGEPSEENRDTADTIRRVVRLDLYAPNSIEAELLINDIVQTMRDSFSGKWRPMSVKWNQESSEAKTASGETASMLLEVFAPVRRRPPNTALVTPTATSSEYSMPPAFPEDDPADEPNSGGWKPR